MGGSMSQVVPGIYVGGLSSAKSESQLNENQITHICTAVHYPVNVDHKRVHKQFLVGDNPEENLSRYFVTAAEFIHGGRVEHGAVLIHCACGISRSVTLTMAYLLCVTEFTLSDIYKALRAARMGACPNSGFLKQLVDFEQTGARRKARLLLNEKFGEWPAECIAADAEAITRLIAIQDEFIRTGYYPGDDVSSPKIDLNNCENSERAKKPVKFICRLPDTMRTLEEALASPELLKTPEPGVSQP